MVVSEKKCNCYSHFQVRDTFGRKNSIVTFRTYCREIIRLQTLKNALLVNEHNLAVLHGTRIWMTDGGEFLEDEEAAEFHLLLVTAAFGRSD